MMINTKNMVSITEANQNFSRVARMAEDSGMALIMKNNRPCFLLLDFNNAESALESTSESMDREDLMAMAKQILLEHKETFEVLAQ